MKKILITTVSVIVAFTIFAVIALNNGSKDVLYLLNWGEYIDEDLLIQFEDETGIHVVEETVTSSETMYQKIKAGTTAYDVAIPGDYMITKLYDEGYLNKIDTSLEYTSDYETMFNPKLTALREENMSETMEYCMPYFWGAYAMIYSTRYDENESIVKTNGFKALFDKKLYSHNAHIGMYNTARWAVASYLMSKDTNPNDESFLVDSAYKNQIVKDIKAANFDMWGDDALKRKTATGDLDLCFTQLGDFFDAVYLALDSGMGGSVGLDALPFDVYVPETTSAFFDGMCIPTTSKNQDAANKFINFMLTPDNAFANALAIGYSPALNSVIDMFNDNPDELYFGEDIEEAGSVTLKDLTDKYPFYLDPLCAATNVFMFEPKGSDYLTECETIVNQSKASVDTESSLGTVLCVCVLSLIILSAAAYTTYVVYNYKKKKKLESNAN